MWKFSVKIKMSYKSAVSFCVGLIVSKTHFVNKLPIEIGYIHVHDYHTHRGTLRLRQPVAEGRNPPGGTSHNGGIFSV